MAAHNEYFDEEAYWNYKDEVHNSDSFHVLSDYGSQMIGGISRLTDQDSQAYRKAVAAAKFAVEEYNKRQNLELKFLQVVSVNVEPTAGFVYYITLEVTEPSCSSSYEFRHFHAKVWSKLSNRFQLQSFRIAPYAAKDSDTTTDNSYCLRIDNLQPWMDENYLYYKCFFTAKQLMSIQVIRNKPKGHGFLRFKSRFAAEKVLAAYDEKLMPSASQVYKLDWIGCNL